MTGTKRPAGEWYSPYFAPMTVFIAVTVLVMSIYAGKYYGNYLIERDRAATVSVPVATVTALPTKAAARTAPAKPHAAVSGKTSH